MRNKSITWLLLVGAMACALLGIVSLLQPARALPPRPLTPTPTSLPTPQPPAPTGAQIELYARFPASWPWDETGWQELWTVVQWRDNEGQWRDVAGWRGTLDRVVVNASEEIVGRKTWWVARENLGGGPFRWLVYRGEGGALLAASDEFTLPSQGGQITQVEALLAY